MTITNSEKIILELDARFYDNGPDQVGVYITHPLLQGVLNIQAGNKTLLNVQLEYIKGTMVQSKSTVQSIIEESTKLLESFSEVKKILKN